MSCSFKCDVLATVLVVSKLSFRGWTGRMGVRGAV